MATPRAVTGGRLDFRDREKSRPKRLRALNIEGDHKKGWSVRHEFSAFEHPSEMHAFSAGDGDKLLAHVAKHLGVPGGDEELGEKEHEG